MLHRSKIRIALYRVFKNSPEMRDQFLLFQHELEQCFVGVDVSVLDPLVKSSDLAEATLRGEFSSLWFIHDRHILLDILDLARLLDFNPAFPDNIEVFPCQQYLVLPGLEKGRDTRSARQTACTFADGRHAGRE
jgi:hypothetical protein